MPQKGSIGDVKIKVECNMQMIGVAERLEDKNEAGKYLKNTGDK